MLNERVAVQTDSCEKNELSSEGSVLTSAFSKKLGLETTNQNSMTQDAKSKVSRAARRREKRANERRAQEEALVKATLSGANSARSIELQSIERRLSARNLQIYEVPSDGDCLYSSVAHQLLIRQCTAQDLVDIHGCDSWIAHLLSSSDKMTPQILRLITAEYLRRNPNEFLPFMFASETSDPMTTDEFLNYCADVEKPSMWGGQLEMRALSNALHIPIEVVQAEGPSILIGEEFVDQPPIILVYHRHAFALGEHYNSCIPLTEDG